MWQLGYVKVCPGQVSESVLFRLDEQLHFCEIGSDLAGQLGFFLFEILNSET